MAEHRGHQIEQRPTEGIKSLLPENGPSGSKVLAVATLFPLGGILLALSGIILTGTVICLAVATPLFVIFSPVLVPAAIVIGLAVAGFLTSGAFGVTALTSLSWIVKYMREGQHKVPEHMEVAKRRMGEAAQHIGPRGKEGGQSGQNRGPDVART